MDVISAIKNRRSTRAFRPTPLPHSILKEAVEVALRAPSWGNIQPWGVAILGGETLECYREAMAQRYREEHSDRADIPFPDVRRHEVLWQRNRRFSQELYEQTGMPWGDPHTRHSFRYAMTRLFDAPHLIVVHVDKDFGPWAILDAGLLMQNIMLAALEYGLGTCCMAASVRYADLLREFTRIPPSRLIVCGIAIGYPDEEAAINRFHSSREPVAEFITWHG